MLGPRTVSVGYDNTKNRATSSTDSAGGLRSIGYDGRGNVTLLGDITFGYDMTDQPVSQSGGVPATYLYDGNLKRVKQVMGGESIYSFYSLSGEILLRVNASNSAKNQDYISVNGQTVAVINGGGSTYSETYRHADHLGSPVMGTHSGGGVLWRESYTPFGEKRLDPAGNRDHTGFTGHIQDDASGLTYMQARYYDPVIGRFLSIDPVGFTESGYNPGMFNRYSYGLNDPVNKIDPDGRQAEGLTEAHRQINQFVDGTSDTQGTLPEGSIDTIAVVIGVAVDLAAGGPSGEGVVIAGAVKGALGAGAKKGVSEAAENRAKNIAKGIPESKLGPSGKPKQHTVEHSTRKSAQQSAKKEADKAGGKVRNDANPANDKQGPHFQAEDAQGKNVKPVVHHERPKK